MIFYSNRNGIFVPCGFFVEIYCKGISNSVTVLKKREYAFIQGWFTPVNP